MTRQEKTSISNHPAPQVTLDRTCICATGSDRTAFRDQPGHRVLRSHFLRSGAYRRVLETENIGTGARTLFYDMPRVPWVPKVKIGLRAGDLQGLGQSDLLGASELLGKSRVSLLELAFDFPVEAGLNTRFVLEHVIFGKSRWTARKVGIVWFGTRRSSKFVRIYQKRTIGVFRIELEFHSSWLRQHGIQDCFDFARIPDLVMRRHIFFCQLDWAAVVRNIRRSVPNARLALRNLEWERSNLHATLRFLRRELRLANTHRFLVPLTLNDLASGALMLWAAQWPLRPFSLRVAQLRIARGTRACVGAGKLFSRMEKTKRGGNK